jgi:hypothetical protein
MSIAAMAIGVSNRVAIIERAHATAPPEEKKAARQRQSRLVLEEFEA